MVIYWCAVRTLPGYLERMSDSNPTISIYEPELLVKSGALPLLDGLSMPDCIRDSSPDAWGRRVIINKKLGRKGRDTDTDDLGELSYLLESGSDRIGALDFQRSPSEYMQQLVTQKYGFSPDHIRAQRNDCTVCEL